jgi:hypothetical protein
MEHDPNDDNAVPYNIDAAQLLKVESCYILANFFRSRFERRRLLGQVWVGGWVCRCEATGRVVKGVQSIFRATP